MLGKRKSAKAKPLIDFAYLDRLSAHLGESEVRELLEDGLIEIGDRLDEVDRLVAAGERAGVLRLAHDLTGMAGHLGLSALSAAAAAIGREGRAEPTCSLDRLVGPLRQAGPAAYAELRRHLRKSGPRAGP